VADRRAPSRVDKRQGAQIGTAGRCRRQGTHDVE
jgi:hypothetical protein